MLLVIDCGNTNTVFAVYDGDERLGTWRISTDDMRTADEYAVWLIQLMHLTGIAPTGVTGAIIATVVPNALFNLRRLVTKYFKVEPLVIGEPGVEHGVVVAIDRPEQVGADRIVNAAEAFRTYGSALIVVDFGTATTFDIVDADGRYIGGVISPGLNLSMDALHMAAAQLPRIAVKRPARVIGKDTVTAMQSGVFLGYLGLIEGIVARIKQEFGGPMTVIGTGGLAPLFADATDSIQVVDEDLTLRGLHTIYRLNTERT